MPPPPHPHPQKKTFAFAVFLCVDMCPCTSILIQKRTMKCSLTVGR